MVKRAKRPILVVGHKSAETKVGAEKPIDYLIRFAKTSKVPVVATAHIMKEFLARGFDRSIEASLEDHDGISCGYLTTEDLQGFIENLSKVCSALNRLPMNRSHDKNRIWWRRPSNDP